jgi:hypothetical protein
METIRASAPSLTAASSPKIPTAACGGFGACDVRRVRLCEALTLPCTSVPREPRLGSVAGTTMDALTSPAFATAQLAAPCRGELPQVGAGAAAGCTQWKMTALSATPWGGPQPGDNPCPTCSTKPGSSALLIDMDAAFRIEGQSVTFSDVKLVIGRDITDLSWDAQTGSRIYPLPASLGLAPGSSAIVCLEYSAGQAFVNTGDELGLSMTATTTGGETRSILVPVLRFATEDPDVTAACGP